MRHGYARKMENCSLQTPITINIHTYTMENVCTVSHVFDNYFFSSISFETTSELERIMAVENRLETLQYNKKSLSLLKTIYCNSFRALPFCNVFVFFCIFFFSVYNDSRFYIHNTRYLLMYFLNKKYPRCTCADDNVKKYGYYKFQASKIVVCRFS